MLSLIFICTVTKIQVLIVSMGIIGSALHYTSGEGNNYTESINEITYESTVKNQNKDGSTTKTVKNDNGSLVFSASATYDGNGNITGVVKEKNWRSCENSCSQSPYFRLCNAEWLSRRSDDLYL